jgi:hypothetical protein
MLPPGIHKSVGVTNLRNAAANGQPVNPRIGIFWLEGDTVHDFSHDCGGIPPVGGFRTSPEDHVSTWKKLQGMVPAFQGKEYDAVPRGRVTYTEATGMFNLLVPPHVAGNKKMIGRISRCIAMHGSGAPWYWRMNITRFARIRSLRCSRIRAMRPDQSAALRPDQSAALCPDQIDNRKRSVRDDFADGPD